ncbi:MAG: penicillin-binding protein 2 [bacterium]|nr:penicillin-binding protein 2 [bacterium]
MKIKNHNLLDPDEILADSFSHLNSPFDTEGKLERSISRAPSFLFLFLIALGFGYLIWESSTLQVAKGETLYNRSQENRFLIRPVFSPRGVIYDEKNRPMVENVPSWGLVFSKDRFSAKSKDLAGLLDQLGELLKVKKDYFFDLGFPYNYDLKKTPSKVFMPQNIPLEDLVTIASKLDSLPGIEIIEGSRRIYKNPQAFSHLLGFVGKISQEDLQKEQFTKKDLFVGKSGIEAQYDSKLRGSVGRRLVEIDARGRETRFKFIEDPEEGSSMKLTIDGEMQKLAYDLLKHYTGGKSGGSVIALDPRDGSIKALVSFPGFNSNELGYNISQKEFEKIINDPLKPLFNRAIAGEFPSGSIIKPFTAVAALQEKLIDPEKKIYDQGFIEIPNPYRPGEGHIFKDWRPHGWINFYDAVALSANVYFYIIGGGYKEQEGLGIDRIKSYLQAFGLGSKTGVTLPGEKEGFLPDPESKKKTDPANPIWRIGDTYNVSIGQGGLRVTPLQMAMATAAIANGGKLFKPRLLADDPVVLVRENMVDLAHIEKVKIGMREAVIRGTSKGLQAVPVPTASKTGTAQVSGGKNPHSWAATFAPVDNPELVILSMGEHGGEGARTAVPVARDLYKWYFAQKDKLSTNQQP